MAKPCGALSAGAAASYRFDVDSAIRYATLAFDQAPTPADRTWAQGVLGFAHCRNGKPEQGIQLLEQLVAVSREVGFVPNEVFSPYLAECYIRSGQFQKAQDFLVDLLARTEQYGMKLYKAIANRLLGELSLAVNLSASGADTARAYFEGSIPHFKALRAENELALGYTGLAHACRRCGDSGGARTYFQMALDIFEKLGTYQQPEIVRAALKSLA